MSKEFQAITHDIEQWIKSQKIFFVATAPLSADGLVNCSPKGLDSFRILDDHTVAYLDLTGSGIETVSHVKENHRITIMFCAFEGPPQIVRVQGYGTVIEKTDQAFKSLAALFPENCGARSIIKVNVKRVSTSCGFAVPFFEYKEDRDTLTKWANEKRAEGVRAYQLKNNLESLDGLPGLQAQDDQYGKE